MVLFNDAIKKCPKLKKVIWRGDVFDNPDSFNKALQSNGYGIDRVWSL